VSDLQFGEDTAEVLNALTGNPEVWSSTALLVTFDENDGFFDHLVSPYPNVGGLAGQSTVPLDNELFNGKAGTPRGSDGVVGPYGLGVRVPLIVVSPWSKGGWVCSEVFDATSLIRFIDDRPGQVDRHIGSTEKTSALLGWHARTAFEDGLERTVAWYRENEAWWRGILTKETRAFSS